MAFPINRAKIASRVAGRKLAAELLECVDDDARSCSDLMEAVVEEFEQFTNRSAAKPVEKEEPIARLGATIVPFGQHAGKDFDSIPLEYLDWLCREQEGFYKRLRAYLKHTELEGRRRGA